jgi:hypothetical protein
MNTEETRYFEMEGGGPRLCHELPKSSDNTLQFRTYYYIHTYVHTKWILKTLEQPGGVSSPHQNKEKTFISIYFRKQFSKYSPTC